MGCLEAVGKTAAFFTIKAQSQSRDEWAACRPKRPR